MTKIMGRLPPGMSFPPWDSIRFVPVFFPKLTLHLPDGKNFTVKAEGNSPANRYIGKALLNESEFTRNYLTHRELTSGGELVLWMDSVPDSRRGTQKEDLPYSYSNGH